MQVWGPEGDDATVLHITANHRESTLGVCPGREAREDA